MAVQTKPQDAIALLKADHRLVEELFGKYEKARKPGKAKLAQQICLELSIHTAIEERVFYPACKGKIEEDTLDEAYVEHDGAKLMIAELLAGKPDDEFYDAKMKVLSEEIKHHVREEEMRSEGMFAQAREAGLDIVALGDEMAALKATLKSEYSAGGVPQPKSTTLQVGTLARGSSPN